MQTETITENPHAGSFVISEQENFMSREEVTFTNVNGDEDDGDLVIKAGTIVGLIGGLDGEEDANSSSLGVAGHYVPLLETGTDGSDAVAGICYSEVRVPAGATVKAALFARLGQVRLSDLTWPSTYNDANKAAAIIALAASPMFIIVRAAEDGILPSIDE